MRLIFWIGYEYFSCYLDETTFNQQNELISEDLLNKLISVYEQATSLALNEDQTEEDFEKALLSKKIFYTVEGTDASTDFNEYIHGERVHTLLAK